MKVLVTGANGLIGKETVQQLLEQGYDVSATDIIEQPELSDVEYSACDIRDFEPLRTLVRGCDAVIHLAALPSPTHNIGPITFDINVMGTYNVFEAAAQEGIKRVVQASSVNAMGMTWNTGDFLPDYFPIDENQTRCTSDPYSLSKQISEDIGDYFWRRDGISSVALRLPGVYPASFYKSDQYYELRDKAAGFIDEFRQWPEDKHQRLLAMTRERVLHYRMERSLEYATKKPRPGDEELGEIPLMLWETYLWFRFMLWALVDVRDASRAFVQGLKADYTGSHPLFINDTGNFAEYDARQLAELFYPGVPIREGQLNGKSALLSIQHARELLGFEPQYSINAE